MESPCAELALGEGPDLNNRILTEICWWAQSGVFGSLRSMTRNDPPMAADTVIHRVKSTEYSVRSIYPLHKL
jgi:hypothetical protein